MKPSEIMKYELERYKSVRGYGMKCKAAALYLEQNFDRDRSERLLVAAKLRSEPIALWASWDVFIWEASAVEIMALYERAIAEAEKDGM